MSLEMRMACERCEKTLSTTALAYICSHECTYCELCAVRLRFLCPNCDGELVRRPKRLSDASVSDCGPSLGLT